VGKKVERILYNKMIRAIEKQMKMELKIVFVLEGFNNEK